MKVLRRVHRHHSAPAGEVVRILPVAFRPNRNDLTGLSVFFDKDSGGVTPAELVEFAGRNPSDYLVVEIGIDQLRALGLSVLSDPLTSGPPGHALVPEINFRDYSASAERKQQIKEFTVALANIASAAVVFP